MLRLSICEIINTSEEQVRWHADILAGLLYMCVVHIFVVGCHLPMTIETNTSQHPQWTESMSREHPVEQHTCNMTIGMVGILWKNTSRPISFAKLYTHVLGIGSLRLSISVPWIVRLGRPGTILQPRTGRSWDWRNVLGKASAESPDDWERNTKGPRGCCFSSPVIPTKTWYEYLYAPNCLWQA